MAQDYNKIFASGASSTQEWTDENYLKGWGYLGQTPPPYQLFDALFKRLDLKTQELNSNQNNIANNYLPLTGGTMDGLLSLFAGSTIPTPDAGDNSKKIVNSEWVQTWVKNFINALDDNLQVQWSSSTFTVPALGITGLMAQNGYICLGKLFGGLILQWGRYDTPRAGAFRLSLPIAFQSRYFSAVGTWDNPNNPEITDDTQNRIIAITATKTEIIIGRNGTGTLAVTYIIIGL